MTRIRGKRARSETVSLTLNLTLSNALITLTPGKKQPEAAIRDPVEYVLSILAMETEDQGLIIALNEHTPAGLFHGPTGRATDPLIREHMLVPSTVLARRNAEWCNTAWSTYSSQGEAYRILSPWWERIALFNAIQADPGLSLKEFKDKHPEWKYLKREYYKNVQRESVPPVLPVVQSARIPYSSMGHKSVISHSMIEVMVCFTGTG